MNTKDCLLWENYTVEEGMFLYPCSFGLKVMTTEEPSQTPSLDFSFKPSLLLPSSSNTIKSNNPSSSSRLSIVPSLSQSLEPSQLPSSSPSIVKSTGPSLLPSVSPTRLSSSNPTSIASATEECENMNEALLDIENKNWRVVCLDKNECCRFVFRDLGDANGFITRNEKVNILEITFGWTESQKITLQV